MEITEPAAASDADAGSTATAATTASDAAAAAAADATIAGTLEALAVLADPHRRQILLRLADAAVCTCTDLVAATGVGQPTVSHHLKVLREAGLVRGERCGRFVEYSAVPERLRDLADAFAALAERAGSSDGGAADG